MERETILKMAHRFRCNCRICGECVAPGEAFYTDGYTTVHLCCFFDMQAKEDGEHDRVV